LKTEYEICIEMGGFVLVFTEASIGNGNELADEEVSSKCTKNLFSLDDSCPSSLKKLEERIRDLESRVPKKYPEVKFLSYKDRKRILVS